MEHRQEHIATLCAVGTVGIAAAGLALGTLDGDSFLIKPGKRKSPGPNATTRSPISPNLPFSAHPPTSQPVNSSPTLPERLERRLSTSILRRKTVQSNTAPPDRTVTESRESSMSRHGILRTWTSDRDSSTERKEPRPGSSWARRISSISRRNHDSPASSSSRVDESSSASRPSFTDLEQPNRLVKRSSSKRIANHGREAAALLKRPATSHQRSATLSGLPYTRPLTREFNLAVDSPGCTSQKPSWRPFFDSGSVRKRYSSGVYREPSARTISTAQSRTPTLLMGGLVEPRKSPDMDEGRSSPLFETPVAPTTTRRHKIRRTLSSVRRGIPQRHFTDPIVRVNKDEAYGGMVPSTTFPHLSPMSNISAFDADLPDGTPVFTSSPPSYGPPQHRFTVPKRVSVAPSDPTTASSDNDTRVFTDDDSMDFHSDTAYDSLATRATASSHSAFRPPKVETIFDERHADQQPPETSGLEDLMQRTTFDDFGLSPRGGVGQSSNVGIGISSIGEDDKLRNVSPDQASTPVKGLRGDMEDLVSTPVPKKVSRNGPILSSSPSLCPFPPPHHEAPELPQMMDLDDDDDDIDWSPKSTADSDQAPPKATSSSEVQIRFDHLPEDEFDEQRSNKRSSIFDWSEHHKFGSDQSNGVSPRPKTVHGKHGNDVGRSRPSGRKSNAATHLRSQSVPVNRDSVTENDLPSSATKFGTWALGSKPVSEEWSDDFEFDDVDENEEMMMESVNNEKGRKRESIRSVKVPQSIMDRQQSVHIQFGQVRDFMLLVEELKRLRVRGANLGLLESHSRQLWEDAESIIDLAAVNEDDEGLPRPSSPAPADIFGDETPPKRVAEEEEAGKPGLGRTINRRSISSPRTPPYGRPRGESLQTKSFLQTIHQNRNGLESSPTNHNTLSREKLPFDTQDLRDLVVRAGVITRALKETVRKAEGVSLSPERPTHKFQDPVFRQIFDPPDSSPASPLRKPGLPKSRSANSYLDGAGTSNGHDISQPLNFTKVVEAN
ncbi:uncharacterized protein Z518_04663 [Rhinocladiella mackenziei CBS 650.93]|uniref:Uncharacterized protein n=1 Tax=Rhinocladiella mackenziei CBS 650.93 TaxID=1442369 RepID=A0A0D2FWQ2_9EURO|nr:uncharacterized protein Z518_04663 [Rhinocladiella mackenziei CBS 650.93]KIX06687.1 hypothetical protein Z518_04663 [Rhinocladiella mackenziei CBS 650.93]